MSRFLLTQSVVALFSLTLWASISRFACVHALDISVIDRPDVSVRNAHYVSNRKPLLPSRWIQLPTGAVRARGWLYTYLQRQRDGLTGQLGEISAWLQKDNNAWLNSNGVGEYGWEEVPYWLKGYCELGYLLDDQAAIDESDIWIEAVLNSQRTNGDFGPDRRLGDGSRDYWANMIMLFVLQSHYERTQDERVLDLMTRYFHYQLTVPDDQFLTGYWQRMRGGDNLYSVYWLYNRTGDERVLKLATKLHNNTADWTQKNTLPNWHNVNIAQAFGEPATYYLQSHKKSHLAAVYQNFREVRRRYGNVPGGMFDGDENCRPSYDDPRQAIETCGLVEQMLSDETLMRITGDPFWADHCEEIAFNQYPAAVMPDFRALRYLTAPNMTINDSKNHHPGIDNAGPFLMMNPFSSRCCQHNHSHGWPYFCKNLWLASPDNGVCVAMYSASVVNVKVGDPDDDAACEVTWVMETKYPFEEQAQLRLTTPKPIKFPLYLRVPGWCQKPILKINDKEQATKAAPQTYIRIFRKWKSDDVVEINFPMQLKVRRWEKNHDAASVNFGPLTFSLKIGEEYVTRESNETAQHDSGWQKNADSSQWPSFEIHPTTPWNYGLVLPENHEEGFEIQRKDWPEDDFPWTLESVPLAMTAQGRRIPAWKLDDTGLCAVLQDSPVETDEPVEGIQLVPMGAARLRISAFPVVSNSADGNHWEASEGSSTSK